MGAFLGRDKEQVPDVIKCAQSTFVDVLCLQEVMDFEVPDLERMYRFVRFIAMTRFNDGTTMGLAICTDLVVSEISEQYYMGDATVLKDFYELTADDVNETKRRPLLTCTVHKDGIPYKVANTHFLYSQGGISGEQHEKALSLLNSLLKEYPSLILCGAMVISRGSPLYRSFLQGSGFEDWVPPTITSTLDPSLHKLAAKMRSGEIPPLVVDYICGIGYRPEEFGQFMNVSDHTPLLAQLVAE